MHVPYERWAKLISLIGFKIINPQIFKEGLELNMMYKDYQSLKNISFGHYICQRDKCVVAFLESISGIAFTKERNNQVKYSICSIIESVYYLRNLNLVLPYSFLFNIVESLISGSKTVTAINGKLHPCGSYPVIQIWLEEQSSSPIKSPAGDIVTFFDNIGKYIINNYQVFSSKSKSADIISTVIHFVLNNKAEIQSNSSLKPNRWRGNLTEKE